MRRTLLQILVALAAAAEVAALKDRKTANSIAEDLPYDENGKLTKHIVVYPAGNLDCGSAHLQETEYGFDAYGLAGEALEAVFEGTKEGDCWAGCLEKGTDRSMAHAIMPYRKWHGLGAFYRWFHTTCKPAEVCLLNYHDRLSPLQVYWISPTGDKKKQLEVHYGERGTKCFSSYIGHTFHVEDGKTGKVLEKLVIEHTTTKAIGMSPPSGKRGRRNIVGEVERTLRNEWKRHNRVTRSFSELGFMKGRLPDDIYASMGAFYYNNRQNKVNEEWDRKGVFVNWWESNVSFIQIPWDLKEKWQFRLKELVEEWAGVPVEQTDMYGLRRYEQGARLLTHVDREATHAVSLIVNIAQGNLTKPWPVEVSDHGDRLHEVIMEPGDIVYYESAKCLHGRNRPLTGPDSYYVNLFTHYRPLKDPQWYTKPNDEDAPAPLVHVDGECQVQKVTDEHYNQLGITEVVRCDDERLGESLSPSLVTARSGEDLIDWWRSTTPEKDGISDASTLYSDDATSSGRDEL